MMGRPTDYTLEIATTICGRLADGEALRAICTDEGMPVRSTVYLWLVAHKEFSDLYARAREEQADTLADEIVAIADSETAPDDRRVRIDARKWVAGKLRPKKYGERQTHEHTGEGGGQILLQVSAPDLNVL